MIDIVKIARHWVGAPFRHQGRSLKDGVDCLGLIFCIGIETRLMRRGYDYTNYGYDPSWSLFHQIMRDAGFRVVESSVLFSMTLDGLSTPHLGIATLKGTFIHSYPPERRVVEHDMRLIQPINYYHFPLQGNG